MNKESLEGYTSKVLIESDSCVQRLLPFRKESKRLFLKEMKAMHALSGYIRISQFVGTVVDDLQQQLKGYLREHVSFSMAKILQENYEAEADLPPLRLTKWACQLLEGVGYIHGRGFVTGALHWTYIAIDQHDDVKITRIPGYYPSMSGSTPLSSGWIAPELRDHPLGGTSFSVSTPEADVFQLGLLFYVMSDWGILFPMDDFSIARWSIAWCTRTTSCTSNGSYCHNHDNPVELPSCEASVPVGYQKAISICRSRDPAERISCGSYSALFELLRDSETKAPKLLATTANKSTTLTTSKHTSAVKQTNVTNRQLVSCKNQSSLLDIQYSLAIQVSSVLSRILICIER